MSELDLGIFLGHFYHEWIEIAERCPEDQRGIVESDYRLDRLGYSIGLGNVLLLDHLDARCLFQRRSGHRMRLVPAEVVARADVNKADDGVGRARLHSRGQHQRSSSASDEPASGDKMVCH